MATLVTQVPLYVGKTMGPWEEGARIPVIEPA